MKDQSMKNTNLTERSSRTEAIGGVPEGLVKTEVQPQPNMPEAIKIDTDNAAGLPAASPAVRIHPPEQIKNPE